MTEQEKRLLRFVLAEQAKIRNRKSARRREADPKHRPEIKIDFPFKAGEESR